MRICTQQEQDNKLFGNDFRQFSAGDRVRVYDYRLFINDKITPCNKLMLPASIISRYGSWTLNHSNLCYDDYGNKYGEIDIWYYSDLVDVQFDHRIAISRGHFTCGIEYLNKL